ncbi:MAG: histidine kinase [Bacteroidota bacterium]
MQKIIHKIQQFWGIDERRQLLRLAVITSPLLAIFRIAPALIFNFERIREKLPDFIMENGGILLAGSFISFNVFVHWIFNIWLLTKDGISTKSDDRWKRKYLWSYLFSFGTIFIPISIVSLLNLPIVQNAPFSFYPLIGTIANNTVILLIINLMLTRNRKAQLELKNIQLEMSNLMAQQEQLKHQLHPHFLFNALYTLRLLIQKKPKQAEEYLNHLSTFLRASIQHSKQDKIRVKEELAFCLDYLELQKVRFGAALQYKVTLPDCVMEQSALPIFTLQLLAENAIKHNAFSQNKPLHFSIGYTEDGWINVQNNIISKRLESDSTGFGLSNLKERFRLLQQEEPQIKTSAGGQYFQVYLPLLSI